MNKSLYVINEINKCNSDKKELKLLSEEKEFDGFYHISLSKSFVLRKHQINQFVNSIKNALSIQPSFTIKFSGYTMFNNDDCSRSFASFYVSDGSSDIRDIINLIDKIMIKYNFPEYYKPSIPHLSVASCPDYLKWNEIDEDWIDSPEYNINYVVCKIGNKIFNIPLKQK